jgi:hypothetical protein
MFSWLFPDHFVFNMRFFIAQDWLFPLKLFYPISRLFVPFPLALATPHQFDYIR